MAYKHHSPFKNKQTEILGEKAHSGSLSEKLYDEPPCPISFCQRGRTCLKNNDDISKGQRHLLKRITNGQIGESVIIKMVVMSCNNLNKRALNSNLNYLTKSQTCKSSLTFSFWDAPGLPMVVVLSHCIKAERYWQ